jgi:hypothetical protein
MLSFFLFFSPTSSFLLAVRTEGYLLHLITLSDTHTHTHTHSVWHLWTRDRAVAETSNWQHTTLTTDTYPCLQRDSNPRSQRTNSRSSNASDSAATGTDVNSTCSLQLLKRRGLFVEVRSEFKTPNFVYTCTPRVPTQMCTMCTDVSRLIYMTNSDYFTHNVKRLVFVAARDYFL